MIDYKTKIQNNILIMFDDFAHFPKSATHKTHGVEYVLFPEYDNPLINAVIQTDAIDANTVQDIKQAVAHYAVPYLWWDITFNDTPDNQLLLESQGYELSSQSPVMVMPIDQIETQSTLNIKRVSDGQELYLWMSILRQSFGLTSNLSLGFYNVFQHIGFSEAGRFHHFIGWQADLPVACSSVFITPHDDIAGLYNIGVPEDRRRQGFGKLMTKHLLHYARSQGINHAFLQSSGMGHRVYKGLGFQDMFTENQFILI